MNTKTRIDQGAPNAPALGLCWCGARFLRATRHAALTALATHEADHHPDLGNARENLRKYTRRNVG